MSLEKYAAFLSDIKNDEEYLTESAVLTFTEELSRMMAEKEITRAELARTVGSSAAYITKVLRGDANFTLSTMVKLAHAVDSGLRLHLAPKDTYTKWYDCYTNQNMTVDASFVTTRHRGSVKRSDVKVEVTSGTPSLTRNVAWS